MKERFIEGWSQVCLTYRKTILLGLLAITLLTGSALSRVRFENAVDIWFLDSDPALTVYQQLLDTFGSDEFIVVGLESPDVFAPEFLHKVDRVSRAIEGAPHVEKVFSLTTVEAITGRDGALEVRELVRFPLDEATLADTRQKALTNDLYVRQVVAPDATFTCIVARIPHRSDDVQYKIEAVAAVREILREHLGSGYYVAGGPTIDAEFFNLSGADSARNTTAMLALLSISLWLLLRTWWGVLLPLVTVVSATVWTIGTMVLVGVKINVITTLLPPLLLAIGIADSMHVLVEYQTLCHRGRSRLDAIRAVYRELLGPLFLASLTTVIGMLSLTVSRIEGIREFGAFAGFGVAAAFFLSATLVPIVLSYLPAPAPRAAALTESRTSTRILQSIHRFTMSHPRAIVAAGIMLAVVAAASASRIRAESAFVKIFKESNSVRLSTERIQDAIGGTVTMDVLIDTKKDDGVTDPATVRAVADLDAFLRAQPDVTSTQSVATYLKDLRRAVFDNDQNEYRLPESREEAAQSLLLYDMDAPDGDIRELVTLDYRKTRVSARVKLESSNTAIALVERTQRYIAEHLAHDVDATVSGLIVLISHMHEYIRTSLIQGFGSAFLLIFAVFCLQMRSIRLGAIVMFANSLPILLTLGYMGAAGIRLDAMTAMVASVAIGLTDDDSIHFVSRVRTRLSEGADIVAALHEALVEVGRALVFSGITLCAGFAVLLSASFVGAIYFGYLTMLTIALALVSDLVLLPALLKWDADRTARLSR